MTGLTRAPDHLTMEPEIVPDFLVPLVKNVHPAQLAALKMRKQRFNDLPSDRPYMRETREAISAVSVCFCWSPWPRSALIRAHRP